MFYVAIVTYSKARGNTINTDHFKAISDQKMQFLTGYGRKICRSLSAILDAILNLVSWASRRFFYSECILTGPSPRFKKWSGGSRHERGRGGSGDLPRENFDILVPLNAF